MKAEFIEVIDEEYGTLRRDYGFVELYFSGGPVAWVMSSGVIELHRLAADEEGMAAEWHRDTGVQFPECCSWSELREPGTRGRAWAWADASEGVLGQHAHQSLAGRADVAFDHRPVGYPAASTSARAARAREAATAATAVAARAVLTHAASR